MPRKKQTDSTGAVKKEKLTDREKLYCRYYLKYYNQTKAYMLTFGVGSTEANKRAYLTHNKKAVQAEIARLQEAHFKQIDLKIESIVQHHLDIAFADINDYIEIGEDGNARLKQGADGRLVSEISYTPTSGGFRIKLADRQKSLDWLAEHLGVAKDESGTGVVILPEIEGR